MRQPCLIEQSLDLLRRRATLDNAAISAAFSQPDPDGAFRGPYGEYLRALGRLRPAVVFAFPPKAAGTFLRTAAVFATGGQLVRIVHAQGGRDAQPYLPLLIDYYLGGLCEGTLVSHIHMQALPANCRILEAFDIKPIVIVRSIPDMLASYWDMLETNETARREGLNCPIPRDFVSMDAARKADFMIDMIAPWYVGYYATWFDYRLEDPNRTCLLRYQDVRKQPAATLARALSHAGAPIALEDCQRATERAWAERETLRFNKGMEGRARAYFSPHHRERLAEMLSFHPALRFWSNDLLGVA